MIDPNRINVKKIAYSFKKNYFVLATYINLEIVTFVFLCCLFKEQL